MKQNNLMKSTSCIVTGKTRISCVEPQNQIKIIKKKCVKIK